MTNAEMSGNGSVSVIIAGTFEDRSPNRRAALPSNLSPVLSVARGARLGGAQLV
jgi:hypothetical protein